MNQDESHPRSRSVHTEAKKENSYQLKDWPRLAVLMSWRHMFFGSARGVRDEI